MVNLDVAEIWPQSHLKGIMDQQIKLSEHETELLKKAVPFAQTFYVDNDRLPTRDELREELHTGVQNAQHILRYLQTNEIVKVANRKEAIPVRAEARATTEYAIPETSGNVNSFVLRENARLARALRKAKFFKEVETETQRREIEEQFTVLKKLAAEEAPLPKVVYPAKPTSGNLLEINIPDAHLGKLAWSLETGYESYDYKIAEAMYRRAQATILDRSSHYSFDRVILVLGNDLLQSDNMLSQTTRGTFVSTDGRYHKTFYNACRMQIDCIEQARKVGPVHVITMPGNHDRLAAWHMGHALEMYFHNYPDVTFDNTPTARKYFEFGVNMWMFTHGDTGSKEDYPLLMATEQPAMFGRTKFREIHCGHTHETKTLEKHGIRVRVLPALCPPDEWHAANGFVGNQRNAEGYIYNDKEGLIGIVIYNDNSQEPLVTKREIIKTRDEMRSEEPQ